MTTDFDAALANAHRATMTNEAIQLVGMLLLEYSNTILEELKND